MTIRAINPSNRRFRNKVAAEGVVRPNERVVSKQLKSVDVPFQERQRFNTLPSNPIFGRPLPGGVPLPAPQRLKELSSHKDLLIHFDSGQNGSQQDSTLQTEGCRRLQRRPSKKMSQETVRVCGRLTLKATGTELCLHIPK
jgi:hypothetical protein